MESQIMCNVTTCRHNEKSTYCSLNSIEIGNTSNSNASCSEQTECNSFECR